MEMRVPTWFLCSWNKGSNNEGTWTEHDDKNFQSPLTLWQLGTVHVPTSLEHSRNMNNFKVQVGRTWCRGLPAPGQLMKNVKVQWGATWSHSRLGQGLAKLKKVGEDLNAMFTRAVYQRLDLARHVMKRTWMPCLLRTFTSASIGVGIWWKLSKSTRSLEQCSGASHLAMFLWGWNMKKFKVQWCGLECHGYYRRLPAPRFGSACDENFQSPLGGDSSQQ